MIFIPLITALTYIFKIVFFPIAIKVDAKRQIFFNYQKNIYLLHKIFKYNLIY